MRDLLRGSLARSLRTLPEEDRLAAALTVVCGPALAAHCAVERLDEQRTLHLRVDTSQWLKPLVAMRDVLQRDLARTSGVALHALEFEPLHRRSGARRTAPMALAEGSTVGIPAGNGAAADRPKRPYQRRGSYE